MLSSRERALRKPAFVNAGLAGTPECDAAEQGRRQATLSNAHLRLGVEAGVHGGVAKLEWNDRGMWTPVFRQVERPGNLKTPRRLSCQPSIWISDAAQGIQGSATSSALRPVARRRAISVTDVAATNDWTIDSTAERSLRLITEATKRYRAIQTYELDGPTLHITIDLQNTGLTPLKCGIEIRPLLVRDSDTRISAPAGGIWIARESGNPPRLVPTPSAWQFGVAYPLPAKAVDHAFTGWGGRALVEWPARQLSLAIVGNTDCYRLRVLPGEDSFSFQVMNDQSGHRNIRDGDEVSGLTVLAAGETLTRRVDFKVESLASLSKTARGSMR